MNHKLKLKSCNNCKYFIGGVFGCKIGWCVDHKEWVDMSRVGCIKLMKNEFILEEEMEII